MPRSVASEIVCQPYVELLGEVNTEGSNIEDTMDSISKKLEPLKNVKLTLSVDELSKLPKDIFSSIHNLLNNTSRNAQVLHSIQKKL